LNRKIIYGIILVVITAAAVYLMQSGGERKA